VLARSTAAVSAGFDLEVGQQVVRENDQLLPGAVGRVGHGGNGMDGQAALELPDGPLVVTPARHEVPEVGHREAEIAGDPRVFVVPIVRVKEIELEVFGRPMGHLLAVDRHREGCPQGVPTAGTAKPDRSLVTRVQVRCRRMYCCRSSQK